MSKLNLVKAKERWEKSFEKKMSDNEFTMFNWGYTYAINDMIEQPSSNVKKEGDKSGN